MTHRNADPTEPDDADRLFARLEAAPVPPQFTRGVLARTVGRPHPWPWLMAGLASLVLLALAGHQLGADLANGEGLELIEAIIGDVSLIATAPGDILAALTDVVPWGLVLVAGLSAACVTWVVGRVVPDTA